MRGEDLKWKGTVKGRSRSLRINFVVGLKRNLAKDLMKKCNLMLKIFQ